MSSAADSKNETTGCHIRGREFTVAGRDTERVSKLVTIAAARAERPTSGASPASIMRPSRILCKVYHNALKKRRNLVTLRKPQRTARDPESLRALRLSATGLRGLPQCPRRSALEIQTPVLRPK